MIRLVFILFFMIIIGALSWVVPKIYLMTLVLGTGIPHIILGAKYSKSGLSLAFNVFWKKAFVLILLPLSFILGIKFGALGLVFYFALHHSISETYSHKSLFEKNIFFNFVYGSLVLSSYLIACRDDFLKYKFLNYGCYVVFVISLIVIIILTRKHLFKLDSIKLLLVYHPWLLGAPVLCLFTFFSPISWMVLILYHFAFWGMLPIFRRDIFKGNKSRLDMFWNDAIKWNGLGVLGIGLLAWWSTRFGDFRLFQGVALLFYIATYWHITISFIISGANPPFIKRLFFTK